MTGFYTRILFSRESRERPPIRQERAFRAVFTCFLLVFTRTLQVSRLSPKKSKMESEQILRERSHAAISLRKTSGNCRVVFFPSKERFIWWSRRCTLNWVWSRIDVRVWCSSESINLPIAWAGLFYRTDSWGSEWDDRSSSLSVVSGLRSLYCTAYWWKDPAAAGSVSCQILRSLRSSYKAFQGDAWQVAQTLDGRSSLRSDFPCHLFRICSVSMNAHLIQIRIFKRTWHVTLSLRILLNSSQFEYAVDGVGSGLMCTACSWW